MYERKDSIIKSALTTTIWLQGSQGPRQISLAWGK